MLSIDLHRFWFIEYSNKTHVVALATISRTLQRRIEIYSAQTFHMDASVMKYQVLPQKSSLTRYLSHHFLCLFFHLFYLCRIDIWLELK